MPAPSTVEEFLQIVRKSGVVPPDRLEGAIAKAGTNGGLPTEPKKMAGVLVRAGLLTHFYADQFLRGVYRGFTIGKYQILERIGSGGMGIVYLGQHKVLEHRVAIKVLPVSLAEHPWFRKRFYREAQAIAALNHPNIVRAHDMDNDGNLHFLIMEFVDGSSLQEIVGKFGPMDPTRAAHYMRQTASGLQHLHEVGLVHRDIKPGNLLLDSAGVIKILDMGLARFFRETQKENFSNKANERTMVGTDDYLAPEQIVNSDDVDIRADIYSLGATFYFLLTGYSPFETEERAYHKLLKHLAQRPKEICILRPQVPAELAAVVEKMMSKNPWERYQTPAAVVEALEAWTTEPIPPPPQREMPRWCPALHLRAAPEESALSAAVPGSGRNSSKFEIWKEGSASSGVLSEPLKLSEDQPATANPFVPARGNDTVEDPPPGQHEPKGPAAEIS